MAAATQTEVATTDEGTTDETAGEAAVATVGAATAGAATATTTVARRPRTRRQKREKEQQTARAVSALGLDLEAVADVEGLKQEVTLLRASIRRLARPDGEAAEHVKVLAELRHQVEALCTALKTQQALDGNGEARAAELARVLDELGDQLGVPR